jgi:hypothetical protein
MYLWFLTIKDNGIYLHFPDILPDHNLWGFLALAHGCVPGKVYSILATLKKM